MVVAVALGLAVAVQTPAQAAFSQCNALAVQMCAWKDANYSGAFRTFSGTTNTCYNLSPDWDQEITSVWNHRPLEELRFYSKLGCAGGIGSAELRINPNSGSANLGLVGGGWNDRARSFRIVWD